MPAIIMMGIPGSGKSTWIDRSFPNQSYPNTKICSADKYFMTNTGRYEFDPSKLGEAHDKCLRDFLKGLQQKVRVVVDNTNTTLVEIAPYVALARAFDSSIEVVYVETDVEEAIRRNIHEVPADSIRAMNDRLQATLQNWPMYWPKITKVDGNTIPSRKINLECMA